MLCGLCLFLAFTFLPQGEKCKDVITDDKKRGYSELSPIEVDVDGDGKLDTITPRTYSIKASRDRFGRRIKELHWIALDLTTSKGAKFPSSFKFDYGTDLADYWVYALIPCSSNRDPKPDLVFYTGDDESDDTVTFVNRNGRFIVVSRRHTQGP